MTYDIELIEQGFSMMHFGCDNDDHREAYLLIAQGLGYKETA
jgi:hypothetical protein